MGYFNPPRLAVRRASFRARRFSKSWHYGTPDGCEMGNWVVTMGQWDSRRLCRLYVVAFGLVVSGCAPLGMRIQRFHATRHVDRGQRLLDDESLDAALVAFEDAVFGTSVGISLFPTVPQS